MKLKTTISNYNAEKEKMEKKVISLEKVLYEYHRIYGIKQSFINIERRQGAFFDTPVRCDLHDQSTMKRDEPESLTTFSSASPKKIVYTSDCSSPALSEKALILSKIKKLGKIMN